ncbi:helix-turn-helix transcriptional regulator [Candidatus Blastococcus massiliensis]|uniref:helix-turn-helix transcriptional regulator n=1 Tax=Candidatus Blastococcus massiliensis TaxID=1470358 RepID=UPI0004B9C82D|nr:helix-turn-helix domain-containing protein [Candidatus Blastococcus massiliensis]
MTAGHHAWTFLTNHGHVLLAVARAPDARVAEIAAEVGVSTRAALSILRDLEEAGYLTRTRVGRRTHCEIRPHQHFRHPSTAQHEIDGLLALLGR